MPFPLAIASPVGGQFINSFGGVLGFLPFQGALPAAGSQPNAANANLLDVRNWNLFIKRIADDTTHTGSFAAPGTNTTCIGFKYSADIVWDVRNPPNFVAANGNYTFITPNIDAGVQMWFYFSDQANFPTDLQPGHYYFSPSVKCTAIVPIIDAASKKEVGCHIEGETNSPIFAMPNEQAIYDNYIAHCKTRNWVW